MRALTIDSEERTQLEALARSTKDKKAADRIRIILVLADGYRARDVATIFRIDEDTVTKWKNGYRKRRLFSDWLAVATIGSTGKLTGDQQRDLAQYVEAETITDAAVIVDFIKAHYGQAYTVNGITKLLHNLVLFWHRYVTLLAYVKLIPNG